VPCCGPCELFTDDCVPGVSSGTIGTATEHPSVFFFLKNAYFSTNVAKNTVTLAGLPCHFRSSLARGLSDFLSGVNGRVERLSGGM